MNAIPDPSADLSNGARAMRPSTDERRTRRVAAGRGIVPLPQAIAACVGFAAFSISILVGLASDNATETILVRAIVSLAGGFAGGFAVGLVCDWIGRPAAEDVPDDAEATSADGSGEFGASGASMRSTDVPEQAARSA